MAPSRRPAGRVLLAIGWATVGVLFVVAVARLVAHDAVTPLIWVNTFSLYLYLPAYPVLLFGLAKKSWQLASMAGLVAICHIAWVAPDFASATSLPSISTNQVKLRIFSANLLMVHPNPHTIISEIHQTDPDLLLLQEYSPRWQQAMIADGIFDRYPHHIDVVRRDSFGTAMFAKTPLQNASVWDVAGLPMTRAQIQIGGQSVEIVNVHTLPPRTFAYTPTWRKQMALLTQLVKTSPIPVALIGDFNATQHAAPYRQLLDAGLYDAHHSRGRGTATTFPNGLFPLPPVRLDHALLPKGILCTSIQEGLGHGSDHRPLIIDLSDPI